MCFRPAESGIAPVCPNCGKAVPVMGGVKLKKCPHCKAEMPDDPVSGAGVAAPGAPGTPSSTPPAPGASTKPGAPPTPGAPKAPGTPQ